MPLGAAHNPDAVPGLMGVLGNCFHPQDITVLLVVHDEATRRVCVDCLREEGYQVLIPGNISCWLNEALQLLPDIILLEKHTDEAENLTRLGELRKTSQWESGRVILLESRDPESPELHESLWMIDETLHKPVHGQEFLRRVRSMAMLTLQDRELLKAMQTRSEQARMWSVLLDFSRSIAVIEDIDLLLKTIVETASEMTCSRRVSIMLPDEDGQYLRVAKAIGFDKNKLDSVRVPIGDAISGKAFAMGRAIVVNDQCDSPLNRYEYRSRSFASFPMVYTMFNIGRKPVGVLNMTDRHPDQPFESWELEFIDLLGSIAGSTIDDIITRQARDDARDSIVVALATLAEYRDNDTGLHVERVTRFSVMLAETLKDSGSYEHMINESFLVNLRRAAPLHDIGKVAIPDAILLKPGKLSPDEIKIIRTHTTVGRQTIQSVRQRSGGIEFMAMAEDIAAYHHEWFDGSGRGYPDNLKGEQIPLSARIVALADVYDAVTSQRVYKAAKSHEQACEIIRESSGTQFDPLVVKAFIQLEESFQCLARELNDQGGLATNYKADLGRRDVA